MDSDLQQQLHFFPGHYQPPQHHQKQTNTGLTRYQSAPSTYFSSILDKDFCEDFLSKPSSPETAKILARFLANSGGNTAHPRDVKQESPVKDSMTQVNQKAQIMPSMNNSNGNDTRLHQQHQHSNYSASSQSFYQSQSKPPLPDHSSGAGMDYRAMTSKGTERLPQMKSGGGNNSNLVRHSSSPAGLFAKINVEFENGYAVMKTVGDFGDTPYSASNRPPPGRISPITEMGKKNMAQNSQNQAGLGEASNNDYVAGYRMGYWEDSRMMSADTKGLTDEDRTLSGIDESETQDVETGSPSPMLAHHLSLPKTSSEISAIEKFLHLQDSVPCKIRAKRGCATHPRSIAERVRRTRISERMRKLQDLVPNMDKQTNTADMLDLAVDYIKDLQMQVKTLSENRAKCTCTDKQ